MNTLIYNNKRKNDNINDVDDIKERRKRISKILFFFLVIILMISLSMIINSYAIVRLSPDPKVLTIGKKEDRNNDEIQRIKDTYPNIKSNDVDQLLSSESNRYDSVKKAQALAKERHNKRRALNRDDQVKIRRREAQENPKTKEHYKDKEDNKARDNRQLESPLNQLPYKSVISLNPHLPNWDDSSFSFLEKMKLYNMKRVCVVSLDVIDDRETSAWIRLVYFNSTLPVKCHKTKTRQIYWTYLKDEGGMLWIRHIDVDNLDNMFSCYSNDTISSLKKNNVDAKSLENVEYVKEKTVLLTGPKQNPGHQYFDVLWSLLPSIVSYPETSIPYSKYYIPFDPGCKLWLCKMLEYLFKDYKHQSPENKKLSIPIKRLEYNQSIRTRCFEDLYIPRYSELRPGHHQAHGFYFAPLLFLRNTLTSEIYNQVELGILKPSIFQSHMRKKETKGEKSKIKTGKRKKILMYDHKSSKKRHWINADEIKDELEQLTWNGYEFDVVLLSDLSKFSMIEQCQFFYEADILIMVHGAQMANTICSRSNTWIIEIECRSSKLWLYNARKYLNMMKILYKNMLTFPDCYKPISNNGVISYEKQDTLKGSYDFSFFVNTTSIFLKFDELYAKSMGG